MDEAARLIERLGIRPEHDLHDVAILAREAAEQDRIGRVYVKAWQAVAEFFTLYPARRLSPSDRKAREAAQNARGADAAECLVQLAAASRDWPMGRFSGVKWLKRRFQAKNKTAPAALTARAAIG